MRIAHVISDTGIGGAGRYLLALLAGVESCGWEVTVYVPEGPLAAAVRASGQAAVMPLPEGDRSFSWSLYCWLHRHLQPSAIVHTHASLAARLAAKQKGYPVVLTRHTLGAPLPAAGLPAWQRWTHRHLAHTLSDAIIAVSQACRQRLLAEGVDEHLLHLVYHGVDAEPYLQASPVPWRQRLGLSPEQKVIVTVARLAPVKGLQHAVAAAALLQRQAVPFTWLFVGQGPQAASLQEQAAALGLGPQQVRWLGYQEDIPGLLAAADIAVVPSLQEALGLVVLEAMAAGLPVVASRVGGIPELVLEGQTGCLVPPAAPKALAQALAQLLQDETTAGAMGRRGRQRVMQQFTIAGMWQQTDAIYRQVLQRRRCGR